MRGCCAARATGAARAPPCRPRAFPKCRASSVIEPGTSSGNPAPRKPVPQTLPPRDRNFDPFTPPPRREYVPTVQRQPGLFPLRGGAQEHEVQRARGADSHPPRGHRNPRVRRSRDDGGVETRFASIVAKGTCCISQIPPTVLPKLVTVVHTSRYTILTLFWQNSKGEPGFDVLQHVPPDAAARG